MLTHSFLSNEGSSKDSSEQEPVSWHGQISKWMTPELFIVWLKHHIHVAFVSCAHKCVFHFKVIQKESYSLSGRNFPLHSCCGQECWFITTENFYFLLAWNNNILADIFQVILRNYFKIIALRTRKCSILICSTRQAFLCFFFVLELAGSQIFSYTLPSDVEANGYWSTYHQLRGGFLHGRDSGLHGGVCCSARLNHPVIVHNEHSKYNEQGDISLRVKYVCSFFLLKLCTRNKVLDFKYLNKQIPLSHRWYLWGIS